MIKRICLLFIVSLTQTVAIAQHGETLLTQKAIPFEEKSELTELADLITQQRLVLLGEASHGTSEFYTKRAFLSKYLIEEHGFHFIAVEGDRKSTRLNSSHVAISYAVFCLKKKK